VLLWGFLALALAYGVFLIVLGLREMRTLGGDLIVFMATQNSAAALRSEQLDDDTTGRRPGRQTYRCRGRGLAEGTSWLGLGGPR
jgi:hypothetical protein